MLGKFLHRYKMMLFHLENIHEKSTMCIVLHDLTFREIMLIQGMNLIFLFGDGVTPEKKNDRKLYHCA
jgi:hypothetical protein